MKESVVFLNDSGPYTFMRGDDEYGHATIMKPKNLRESMRNSWFQTYFCRYINNETYYDINRNITREIWYYRSGEIVDEYINTYDHLNRLTAQNTKNKYSEKNSRYFYDGNRKKVKFSESYYKRQDEPGEKIINNWESFNPLFITKFDTLSKTDSIFAVTNDIWKAVGNGGYSRGKDSIYHKKLNRVKIYDSQYRVVEEKFFEHENDLQNKKIYLTGHFKYEYDKFGNIIKRTSIKDGKFYSYIILGNGKMIKEEKNGDSEKNSYTIYVYTKDQKLEKETSYYQNRLSYERKFEYKGNYITRLIYLDKPALDDKIVEPVIIDFRYKFDKQNNWTEIIKNVNGKDLYRWIRKIEYY
ncbi:hypothetical protein M9991_08040 [Chryseobacterium gallinarum]|uniref:hypothetical protein n=1 Tax=Chryseobacterium gallinarum TaxID=1324352 RepID=UPI0020243588|nr:hypothetical protein [Chryseobacterium gallinarum]MCL8536819.1 hypothetical protein [Chryseobacterium gallinarum]